MAEKESKTLREDCSLFVSAVREENRERNSIVFYNRRGKRS